jgi:NTP pyrophosphohydrolases including oxidative damage repair enzymes
MINGNHPPAGAPVPAENPPGGPGTTGNTRPAPPAPDRGAVPPASAPMPAPGLSGRADSVLEGVSEGVSGSAPAAAPPGGAEGVSGAAPVGLSGESEGVPGVVSAPGGPSGGQDGGVPAWLRDLAARAATLPVPAELRPPAEGGRPSAVLLLFGEGPDGPDILLIQRSARGRLHAGQPAFPGGGVDPGDGGPIGAALREAQEETGLDPSGVTIVGTMPEVYVWRSDNRVTPVLGWWHTPCAVHPAAPDEVDAVERVPIAELVDPRNRLRLRSPRGIIGPAFRVRGLLVWGFTAAVLSGVLTAAGFDRPWNRGRIEDLPPDILNLAAR